jgi:hypothetical protein
MINRFLQTKYLTTFGCKIAPYLHAKFIIIDGSNSQMEMKCHNKMHKMFKPSFRLYHVLSLFRFFTKLTYVGYEIMPLD